MKKQFLVSMNVLAVLAVFVGWSIPCPVCADEQKPKPKTTSKAEAKEAKLLAANKAKLRKLIERKIGRNKTLVFVVAISNISYPNSVERTIVANNVTRTEIKIGGNIPVHDVRFYVYDDRAKCIEFVYEQLAKFVQGKPVSRKAKRGPSADWTLVGRYKDAKKAAAAKSAAELRYGSQPRWVSGDTK